jgi:hypothetical protein
MHKTSYFLFGGVPLSSDSADVVVRQLFFVVMWCEILSSYESHTKISLNITFIFNVGYLYCMPKYLNIFQYVAFIVYNFSSVLCRSTDCWQVSFSFIYVRLRVPFTYSTYISYITILLYVQSIVSIFIAWFYYVFM